MQKHQETPWDKGLGSRYGLDDTIVDLIYDIVLTIYKANGWASVPKKFDVVAILKAEEIAIMSKEILDEQQE